MADFLEHNRQFRNFSRFESYEQIKNIWASQEDRDDNYYNYETYAHDRIRMWIKHPNGDHVFQRPAPPIPASASMRRVYNNYYNNPSYNDQYRHDDYDPPARKSRNRYQCSGFSNLVLPFTPEYHMPPAVTLNGNQIDLPERGNRQHRSFPEPIGTPEYKPVEFPFPSTPKLGTTQTTAIPTAKEDAGFNVSININEDYVEDNFEKDEDTTMLMPMQFYIGLNLHSAILNSAEFEPPATSSSPNSTNSIYSTPDVFSPPASASTIASPLPAAPQKLRKAKLKRPTTTATTSVNITVNPCLRRPRPAAPAAAATLSHSPQSNINMSLNSRLSYSPSSSNSTRNLNAVANDDDQIGNLNLNDHFISTANAAHFQPPAPKCLADQPENVSISIAIHELPTSISPQSLNNSLPRSSGHGHADSMQQEGNIIKTKKRRGGRKRRPKTGGLKSDPMISVSELDSIPISMNPAQQDHQYHNGYYSPFMWYPYHNVEVDREIYSTGREDKTNHNFAYAGYDHPSTNFNGEHPSPPKGPRNYGGGWGTDKKVASGGGKKVRFMLDPEAPIYK
ncbi:hypothetical protein DFH27DRAFT_81435 [Peziza echinospora]|nr:hypothetical protein DFH27DRAFT_81435 [Peziza echinospora]